jgi:hypothetical protein
VDQGTWREWFNFQKKNPDFKRYNAAFVDFLWIKNHKKFDETFTSNLNLFHKGLYLGLI